MKKIFRFLLSPTALMLVLMLAQFAILGSLIISLGLDYIAVFFAMIVVSLILGIILFDKAPSSPSYKLMWLWIFTLLPLVGELLYFIWGRPGLFKKKESRFLAAEQRAAAAQTYDEAPVRQLEALDRGLACQARYLVREHNLLYDGTTARYFGNGEDLYPVLLEELEKAQHSIWLEYFIYNADHKSWQTILEILKRKAADGVDVRILYDSVGCLFSLPPYYALTLQRYGIRCYEFNPVRFSLHISDYGFLNHRDHRKLCIIDGMTGFTGGINMADEYFGMAQPYGQWKDSSLMLRGPAVYSFTCTFLKMWGMLSGDTVDYTLYRPQLRLPTPDDLLVQPFDDTPLDTETVSQNAYSNVLRHAHRYVWITTPYLIPDYQMIESLCLTAKSGVEVRIITPGIPDKKSVFLVTRSYYRQLLENGIHIYEYAPGFIHSKMYLCDDKIAIVGSANMDYRSLYLHFENCCSFYGGRIIGDIHRDFEKTLEVCREITEQDLHFSLWVRIKQVVLRFFAPLL